jgi:DNA-binding PadR family transcriptional regulator
MSTSALDPLVHHPERLRVVATLAALPDGDTLSLTRLQDMIGLPPGSLIACLRELGRAGYMRTGKTGVDRERTVALTCDGRAALDHYSAMLRQLPWAGRQDHQPPAPGVRAGDADRDAAAAALGEHFAQGRLTLDELNARLDATLAATTHGELSQAARDLPDLTVFSACTGSTGLSTPESGLWRRTRGAVLTGSPLPRARKVQAKGSSGGLQPWRYGATMSPACPSGRQGEL